MKIDLIPLTSVASGQNTNSCLGDTTAIVAVPAFPLTGAEWTEVASQLDEFPFFTLNHPGIGAPTAPYSEGISDYADAAIRAILDSGYQHVVMVGNSMGGYVSQAAAIRHPGSVSGLVLVGTKAGADSPEQKENREKVAEQALITSDVAPTCAGVDKLVAPDFGMREPTRMQALRGLTKEVTPTGIAWCQRAMAQRPDRLLDLSALDIPVAVIHGRYDSAATIDDAQDIANSVGTALVLVDTAGHLVPVEAPDVVASHIRNVYGAVTATA